MPEAPPSGPVVECSWLAAQLGAPDVSIVDASWRMPGTGVARDDYQRRRIPGAVFFDIDDIADGLSALPHMAPPAKEFASAVAALGISNADRVVVYDDAGLFSAARVWWTFRLMGHERVYVLNGGLPAWISAGHPVDDSPPAPRPAKTYVASVDGRMAATAADVAAALADDAFVVVDARPRERFDGVAPEPRPGLRRGHMPGAVNIPFGELFDGAGRLKPPPALNSLFDARLGPRKPVTTCGSGVTAAIISLALAYCGRDPGLLYDGSWAEWGDQRHDDDEYPVRTNAP